MFYEVQQLNQFPYFFGHNQVNVNLKEGKQIFVQNKKSVH